MYFSSNEISESSPEEIATLRQEFGLDQPIFIQYIRWVGKLLQGDLGKSILFIAHDLSVVRHISNRIAVMYLGRIVEITDQLSLYENPLHPYTNVLLSAVPVADPFLEEIRQRIKIRGEIPSPLDPPAGCHFHPRCPEATDACKKIMPELKVVGDGHEVACIRVSP